MRIWLWGQATRFMSVSTKCLMRRRGELVERTFAHCCETGGMRRCTMHVRDNILKRLLVHVGAFSISLVLRKMLGAGKPRELKNRAAGLVSYLIGLVISLYRGQDDDQSSPGALHTSRDPNHSITIRPLQQRKMAT